jgi:peptidoglycan/LPS O-acetylase OafA/YrhL
LRALAVLSVVFFHFNLQKFGGGFVGVDIFFVISGYLITLIIVGDLEAGSFTFARFYEWRIRRIIPALIVMLAASSIAAIAPFPRRSWPNLVSARPQPPLSAQTSFLRFRRIILQGRTA